MESKSRNNKVQTIILFFTLKQLLYQRVCDLSFEVGICW